MSRTIVGRIMDFAVSGYVFFVALLLVLFMVSTLVAAGASVLFDVIDMTTGSKGFSLTPDLKALELQLLHTIAFTIVLVKAYKILISFAETQHINLKLLVEIAIIAPTIELIFNTKTYDFYVNLLFAGFAVVNLVIYLYFYKTLKIVSDDYVKENS